MLGSITPLGERGRKRSFAVTSSAFVLGSVLGGVTIGALCGLLGTLLSPSAWVAAAGVTLGALGAAALDSRLAGLSPPTIRRQVNEDWMDAYRGWVYGLGFGYQLGFGLFTIVTTAAVYATLVCAVLTGSLTGGLIVGAVFGLTRGLNIFVGARVQRPDQLVRLHRRFAALASPVAWGAVAALLAVGVAGGLSLKGLS